jgi:equilibrative nucleoside transporter 1/2/3
VETLIAMDRLRQLLPQAVADEHEYEPLEGGAVNQDNEPIADSDDEQPFSRLEYAVFLLLGVAMLWAWYVASTAAVIGC